MPDELYRKMGYGKVYFVEGSDSSLLNEYMRANAKRMEERVNHDERNWVTCSLVCLDAHNSLFASGPDALFYSALIPSENDAEGAFPFLKATLREPEPHLFALFDAYFESLQHAFDDALDGEDNFFSSLNEESLSMPDAECLMAESCDYSCVEPSVDAFYDRKLKPSSASMERADRMFSFGSARMRRSLCEPSRLQITPCTYDVLLPDYEREIHFTAQVKALYVLFLNHPEGIRMKEIEDYKEEYKQLYLCLTNRSDIDKLRWSVEKLLDVCNPNALNVKKSQCNAAISCAIPEYEMRRYYEIEVNRGQPHRINLDRSLVSLPEELRQKKSL